MTTKSNRKKNNSGYGAAAAAVDPLLAAPAVFELTIHGIILKQNGTATNTPVTGLALRVEGQATPTSGVTATVSLALFDGSAAPCPPPACPPR